MPLEPLTFEKIEGGKLRDDLDAAFEALQSALIAHCQKHEGKAEGATAELNLKIKLKVMNPHDWFVEVASDLKIQPPARPQIRTSGVGQHRRQGQPVLFCRTEGSDYDDPRQSTIFGVEADAEVKDLKKAN